MSLLAVLRTATASLHREVERSTLIAALLRGEVERGRYVLLLRQLAALYGALEAQLDAQANARADAPIVAAIHDPRLARGAALAADLECLHGADWSQLPIAQPMPRYLLRLAVATPEQLLAHAYVRYLGDLAGGQILGRIVGQALALPDDRGRQFYRFPEPGAAVLAARFRDGLEGVSSTLSAERRQAIVDEAVLAFRLHGELFSALAAAPLQPPSA